MVGSPTGRFFMESVVWGSFCEVSVLGRPLGSFLQEMASSDKTLQGVGSSPEDLVSRCWHSHGQPEGGAWPAAPSSPLTLCLHDAFSPGRGRWRWGGKEGTRSPTVVSLVAVNLGLTWLTCASHA